MSLNTNLGTGALANNSTGSNNVAVGGYALTDNTSGNNNAAFGTNSQLFNTTGSNNVSVGPATLMSINGTNDNTAIGANALEFNANGVNNVAVGSRAGYIATSGNYNTFLGAHADVASNNYFEYSAAVGYGSKITADHQIVLGTSDENVIVLTNPLNYSANSVVPKSYVDSFVGGATGPQGPTGARGPQGLPGSQGESGPSGPVGQIGLPGINAINGGDGPTGPRGFTGLKGSNGGLIGYMNYLEYITGFGGVTYSQIAFSQASDLSGATAVYVTNGSTGIIQSFLSSMPLPVDDLEEGIYTPNIWVSTAGTTGMVLSTSLSIYDITTGGTTLIADSSPIEISSVKLTNYNQSTGTGSSYSGATGLYVKFDIYCDSSASGSGETFYISYQNKIYYSFLSTSIPSQGPPGPKGDTGQRGNTGVRGLKGFIGSIGPQGQVGPMGEPGSAGEAGGVGPQGDDGVQGPPGEDGLNGHTGPKGLQGVQGPTGPAGPAGVDGGQGATGPRGDTGEIGFPGAGTFFPSGGLYSDYFYWNPTGSDWKQGSQTIGTVGAVHIGPNAGSINQSNYSIAIGPNSGYLNQGGSGTTGGSIAIGAQAGYSNQGINSIAIGPNAGYDYQGDYSIAIGRNAQSDFNRSVAIGQNATTTSVDQMMLGEAGVSVVANGDLNVVGNATANGNLNVVGNATGITPANGDSSTQFATTEWVTNNAPASSNPIISRITRSGVNSMLFSSGNQLYECHAKASTGAQSFGNFTSGRSVPSYNAAVIGNYGFERAAQLYFPFGPTSPRNLVDFNTTSDYAYALFKPDGYTAASGGDLYTWGGNGAGQCGQGTTVYVGTPKLVTGLTGNAGVTSAIGNIVEVYCNAESINGSAFNAPSANGSGSRLFIRCKQDNLIYGCGYNNYGALGLGNTTNKSTLTAILGSAGYKNVWNMGASYGVLVCQDSSNNVLACGYGDQGCLGNGARVNVTTLSTTLFPNTSSIVTVCGGFGYYDGSTQWGFSFMCILFSNNSIRTVGNQNYGSLGNNAALSNVVLPTPYVFVHPVSTGPTVVSMKSNNTGPGAMYLLYSNGEVYSWGYNGLGQLGVNSTTNRSSVALVGSNVARMFTTSCSWILPYYSNLFVTTNENKLWSCGMNSFGECGQGVSSAVNALLPMLLPTSVVADIKDIGYYAQTGSTTAIFLVTNSGAVYSWGYNATSGICRTLDQANIFSPIPVQFVEGE
jgi:hypothetical protein